MSYYINPDKLSAVFQVPSAAVDTCIKLASEKQIKCLLLFLRGLSSGFSAENAAKTLGIPESEVLDALNFWTSAGILMTDSKKVDEKPQKSDTARIRSQKPNRDEVIERGRKSDELKFLLREAQNKFMRPLKQSEASLIVWLYDDEGMSPSLVLMLLQYCIGQNQSSVRYIEKTASEWLGAGITDISSAEEYIATVARQNICWKAVSSAFGIPSRVPSPKERTYADLWVNEWKYPKEVLNEAYNQCVDTTSKFSMAYIAKILEKWHKNGVKTLADVKALTEKKDDKKKPADYAGYDVALANKLLNSED